MVDTLLTESIPTEFGIEYNLAEVVDSLTVELEVETGSSGIDIPRSSIVTGVPDPQTQEEMIGTRDDDVLYGTDKSDFIQGKAGDDLLYSYGGNDTLIGNAGDDIIYGGLNKDRIRAGRGDDAIFGNGGKDRINSGEGEDVVWLGQGSATIVLETGAGFDTINNFQLGETKIKVNQIEDLQFDDTEEGMVISQADDLLGSIPFFTASEVRSNINEIFLT